MDFHTSPLIPDVGVEFDAPTFAKTLQEAHVNSVTVFAKCHHGMCYFPTQTGVSHPALGERDLLGEQIEALHRLGIRAPIYTTVAWEEDVAQKHPEWRQLTKNGAFAKWDAPFEASDPGHQGTWKLNNFLHPDYQAYIEAHIREICSRYGSDVDGFFFDILFFAPGSGYSPASLAFRKKHNLMAEDADTFARFNGMAQKAFSQRFTRLVMSMVPNATVFYNSQNDSNMDPAVGPRARAANQTHCEIESLPSGSWGYYHFPRMARAQGRWGKPWLGMTGRFQRMWGDFGGIKPQAALEYECFRAQALGGANSIGDQLPPRGTLDPAAYKLIGAVYGQCKEAEPFYQNAALLPAEVGIFSASHAGHDGGSSEEGAVHMCQETHYDSAVLDSMDAFDDYKVLLLPDSTIVDPGLAKKLEQFHENGGTLILSHKSGFDAEGNWALDFIPLTFSGEEDRFPTYWRATKRFDPEMADSDRVVYAQGMKVRRPKGAHILVDRVLPYFKRTAVTFSSHFQTPPIAKTDRHPAVLRGEGFVYFADPIFAEYRKTGNIAVRDVWKQVLRELIGPPHFGDGLPTTIEVYPMRRQSDLILTLLHYVPVRKALDIDVIEERHSFAGEILHIGHAASLVVINNDNERLPRHANGGFVLPNHKGRLLLTVPDYFTSA
jgi:hypothetical protein